MQLVSLVRATDADGKPQLDPWPFPEQFRPSRTAEVGDDSTVYKGAKCRVSYWTGGPSYQDEINGGTQLFPQNPYCNSSPPGIPDRDISKPASTYGFKCFSDGKCSIFPTDEGDGQSEREDHAVDGIAREGQWGDNPEW